MVPGGHGLVRARDARRDAARDRDDSRDRRADRRARRCGPCLRGRRRRLLPRRELRELRRALRPAARPGRGAGAEPVEGGHARLRALEGDEGGRGHLLGLAVGPGEARVAHRVLGDGREDARARVPDPRRRPRSRLPSSRERAGAVAGRRSALREDLDAQRVAPVHRREDVQVGRQRRHDPGGRSRSGDGRPRCCSS